MWMILHVDSFWHRDKRQIAYYQVPEFAIMILIAKCIAQRIEEIIYPGVERCIFEFFAFVSFSFSFLLWSRWILSLLLFVDEASSQPAAEFSETDERYLETLHSLLSLRAHVREIEDANMCAICLEKARNVAFMCGHGTCVECATSLEVCPMCRKPIEKKITLFNWSKCFYERVILRKALFWVTLIDFVQMGGNSCTDFAHGIWSSQNRAWRYKEFLRGIQVFVKKHSVF